MDMKRIRRDCDDCRKTHRYAEIRSDFDYTRFDIFRIIGIGVKYVRVMSNAGTIFKVKPEDIRRAW